MTATKNVIKLVEAHLEDLVHMAEQCVERSRAPANKNLEESQLRNLQNLAAATDSLAVIRNYIRYQIGREQIPKPFGNAVEQDLDQIKNLADTLCRQNQITDPEQIRKAQGEMVRYYFGFLTRKFVAERKGGKQA